MCFKFRLMLRRHDCRAGVEEASPSSFTSTMNKRQMCTFLLSGSKPSALQSRIMTITIHGNKLELPITITLLAASANGPFCFHVLYVALGHSRLFSKLVIRDDIITRTLTSLCCWLTGEEWFGFGSSLSGTFWPQPPLPTLDAEWGHFSLQTSSCAIIPQSPFGHRVIWHSDIPAERLQTYSRINTVYWKIHCGVDQWNLLLARKKGFWTSVYLFLSDHLGRSFTEVIHWYVCLLKKSTLWVPVV